MNVKFKNSILFLALLSFNSLAVEQNSISIKIDNDVINQSDKYYSNGLTIRIDHQALKTQFPWKILKGDKGYLSFNHEIYTPENTSDTNLIESDHRYSGVLYSDIGVESDRRSYYSSKSISFGVIGPLAFGGEIQNGIHSILPSHPVEGWENQNSNDLILNFNYEYWYKSIGVANIESGPITELQLGTYQTNASVGWNYKYYNRALNLVGKMSAVASVYNANLQGGLLSSTKGRFSSNEIIPLYYLAEVGASYKFSDFKLSLSNTFIGKQFEGGRSHSWTSVDLKFFF